MSSYHFYYVSEGVLFLAARLRNAILRECAAHEHGGPSSLRTARARAPLPQRSVAPDPRAS